MFGFLFNFNSTLVRLIEAALMAGFKIGIDGKFLEWVENCIVGENDDYNMAIASFVTHFNIADLPAYVMYREIFFSEFQVAMRTTDSKLKKVAMDNAEKARIQVTELEKKLFTAEETINVRNALYILAERQKLNLRPEGKANEIAEKKLSVNDPYYGKKYIP
jgi:DNA-directed RNA polymerase alpha subunit